MTLLDCDAVDELVASEGGFSPALEGRGDVVVELRTGDVLVPYCVEKVEGAFVDVGPDVAIVPAREFSRRANEGWQQAHWEFIERDWRP